MTRSTADRRPGGITRRDRSPLLVLAAAAAAAALVWLTGAALGIEPVARTGAGTRTVGLPDVLVAGGVAALLGWAVRALLGRLVASGGRRAWLVLCAVVTVLSLGGPLGATTGAAAALLVAEHLVVGAVVALGLRDRAGAHQGAQKGRGL